MDRSSPVKIGVGEHSEGRRNGGCTSSEVEMRRCIWLEHSG